MLVKAGCLSRWQIKSWCLIKFWRGRRNLFLCIPDKWTGCSKDDGSGRRSGHNKDMGSWEENSTVEEEMQAWVSNKMSITCKIGGCTPTSGGGPKRIKLSKQRLRYVMYRAKLTWSWMVLRFDSFAL